MLIFISVVSRRRSSSVSTVKKYLLTIVEKILDPNPTSSSLLFPLFDQTFFSGKKTKLKNVHYKLATQLTEWLKNTGVEGSDDAILVLAQQLIDYELIFPVDNSQKQFKNESFQYYSILSVRNLFILIY